MYGVQIEGQLRRDGDSGEEGGGTWTELNELAEDMIPERLHLHW